jgi:hypothetical protein
MKYLFLASSIALAGCDSCTKRLPVDLQKVPPDEAEKSAKLYFPTAAKIASTLCGVPVRGLQVKKLEVDMTLALIPGECKVNVEGVPIPDEEAGVDLGNLALCAGVVHLMLSPKKNADGTVKSWEIYSADVRSVSTPGVKWEPPKSKGGSWD